MSLQINIHVCILDRTFPATLSLRKNKMAKIKLTFTEEQLSVIGSMSFGAIRISHNSSGLPPHISAIRRVFNLYSGNPDDDNRIAFLADRLDSISEIADKSVAEARLDEGRYYGLDTYSLFGDTGWLTAMSLLTGDVDKYGGFEFDKYPPEVIDHYADVQDFILENITYIGQLVFQMAPKGGLKAGVTYVCLDREGIWYEEADFDKRGK